MHVSVPFASVDATAATAAAATSAVALAAAVSAAAAGFLTAAVYYAKYPVASAAVPGDNATVAALSPKRPAWRIRSKPRLLNDWRSCATYGPRWHCDV